MRQSNTLRKTWETSNAEYASPPIYPWSNGITKITALYSKYNRYITTMTCRADMTNHPLYYYRGVNCMSSKRGSPRWGLAVQGPRAFSVGCCGKVEMWVGCTQPPPHWAAWHRTMVPQEWTSYTALKRAGKNSTHGLPHYKRVSRSHLDFLQGRPFCQA